MKIQKKHLDFIEKNKKDIKTFLYWTSSEDSEKKAEKLFYLSSTCGISLQYVERYIQNIYENTIRKFNCL